MERRLRQRIGQLIAAQVVEEEEEGLRLPRGQGNYHRLNAVLKRVMGGKGRGEMTLDELEATRAEVSVRAAGCLQSDQPRDRQALRSAQVRRAAEALDR
ncbi:hypothetical protein ACFQU2_42215 [Siccirubricoccus deserti]|uniref:Uncharacterized protein n=1 Tax=Siccirubricoccus deserti TaxID=2013562 RepID=A0A9X0UG02_9PROT|nr:hypothetical protein [Siccirubricoccus deserti]MBC4018418.1 hypothetical protein [Siccirubricoccus deserti]